MSGVVTNQLKGLTSAELTAAGEQYQQLKEARDLEDILFSS